MPFVERMPIDKEGDTKAKHRVTANPLMLSMVASGKQSIISLSASIPSSDPVDAPRFVSVFEIRKGVGMPETVAELYESASDAMLARGGVVSTELRMCCCRPSSSRHTWRR